MLCHFNFLNAFSSVSQPNLFIKEFRGRACRDGYQDIYDEELCKKASNVLKLVYSDADSDGKSESVCNRCSGCEQKTVRVDNGLTQSVLATVSLTQSVLMRGVNAERICQAKSWYSSKSYGNF